ncbi:N-acetyltransferase family protein [Kineococcus sp. LSe6-4]|uniref:N-acetyltransferase family protein n=1 Tax=Kineococcus halophytocola TaxID=3234027 RepID=A0ABV4GV49_9ACTN
MIGALTLPVTLRARDRDVVLRRAVEDDLTAVVELLADDTVSTARGDRASAADEPLHRAAMREILADPANDLLVATDAAGTVVGTLQLTRIPGMARRGATRLRVEAVRVRSTQRSGGIGAAVVRWVTDVAAPATGSALVQLTSDDARTDAHRFYERLGFTGSHRGFTYAVAPPARAAD